MNSIMGVFIECGYGSHARMCSPTLHNVLQRWANKPCSTLETTSMILGLNGFLSTLNLLEEAFALVVISIVQ
jgi:hypothetical protein